MIVGVLELILYLQCVMRYLCARHEEAAELILTRNGAFISWVGSLPMLVSR